MVTLESAHFLQHYRTSLVVRGIVSVLFGVLALVWPGLTLFVLVYLFGIYALVDGVAMAMVALKIRHDSTNWWLLLLGGLLGIVLGIMVFVWPGITSLVLLLLIAIWAIGTGFFEIVSAFTGGHWLMIIVGALSILLGILLLVQPIAGILSLVWVLGFYAFFAGIIMFIRAFQIKTLPA